MGGGYVREFESELAVLYRLSDVMAIIIVLWVAMRIRGVSWSELYVLAAVLGSVIFYLFAQVSRAYRSWRMASFKETLGPVLISWMLTVFALLFLAYVTKHTGEFSRIAMSIWILLVPVVLTSWRYGFRSILRYMRARGYNLRTVAIGGMSEKAEELGRYLETTPEMGMRLIGFFDDECMIQADQDTRYNVTREGNLNDLVTMARQGEIDMIYLALPIQEVEKLKDLLYQLSDTTASVYFVPDFFTSGIFGSRWMSIGSMSAVSVYETPFLGVAGLAKRLEDIVLVTLILPLIAIPMLLIAMTIKLLSPGPVIFKQQRYGLDGRRIRIWKFRTMRCCEDGSTVIQAKQNDPRVTQFGAFLRRTSLDELPQFFNVLMGDMSVVGPRPHAVAHNELYRSKIQGYMLRHKVKPGITGWAQVNGWRGETDSLQKMEKRVEHDLWYIKNWSLLLDLRLILKTIFGGLSGRNAY